LLVSYGLFLDSQTPVTEPTNKSEGIVRFSGYVRGGKGESGKKGCIPGLSTLKNLALT